MKLPKRKSAVLTGHGGPVHCVTFSAGLGQYVLTGAADRTIRLFNPQKAGITTPTSLPGPPKANPSAPGLIQTYSAHGYEVLDITVSDDNARFASVGGDRQVFLWDVTAGSTLRRWAGHGGRVNAVQFGGEGASVVVSGSFDATVRIWDCKSQSTKPIQVLDDARDSVSSLHVSGHEIVSGSVDGRLRQYDLRMGMVYEDVIGQPVTSLQTTVDSSALLVSTLDSTIRLLDKGNGRLLQSYKGHRNADYRIRSIFAFNDSLVLSGSEDGDVFAWNMLDGTIEDKLENPHSGKVVSAVASKRKIGTAKTGASPEWASAGSDGELNILPKYVIVASRMLSLASYLPF